MLAVLVGGVAPLKILLSGGGGSVGLRQDGNAAELYIWALVLECIRVFYRNC